MDLILIKENYLNYVKGYYSQGTYECYCSHLNFIVNYFNSINIADASELTRDNLTKYLNYEKSKNISNSTINKRINVLRRSLEFSNIEYDLFCFKTLKEKFITFNYITENELINIINYVDNSKLSIQNKLIFFLLLETGMRRKEIINIKVKNIFQDKRAILLTFTKENTERYVIYSDYSDKYLKLYLHEYKSEILFADITVQAINSFLRRLQKNLDLKHLSSYVLRHSFATMYLNNKGNIEILRKLMGHKSLTTTMRYLHTSLDDIINNYNNTFPKLK